MGGRWRGMERDGGGGGGRRRGMLPSLHKDQQQCTICTLYTEGALARHMRDMYPPE